MAQALGDVGERSCRDFLIEKVTPLDFFDMYLFTFEVLLSICGPPAANRAPQNHFCSAGVCTATVRTVLLITELDAFV